jgi:hypothetical protein
MSLIFHASSAFGAQVRLRLVAMTIEQDGGRCSPLLDLAGDAPELIAVARREGLNTKARHESTRRIRLCLDPLKLPHYRSHDAGRYLNLLSGVYVSVSFLLIIID